MLGEKFGTLLQNVRFTEDQGQLVMVVQPAQG